MQRVSGSEDSHSLRFVLKASEGAEIPLLSSSFLMLLGLMHDCLCFSVWQPKARPWSRTTVSVEWNQFGIVDLKAERSIGWFQFQGAYTQKTNPGSFPIPSDFSLRGSFAMLRTLKSTKIWGLYIYIYTHREFALKDIKLQCYSVKNLFWCGFFYYYVFYPGLLVFFLIFYYFF